MSDEDVSTIPDAAGPCPAPSLTVPPAPPIPCDLPAGHSGDHVGGEHRTRWRETPDTVHDVISEEAPA